MIESARFTGGRTCRFFKWLEADRPPSFWSLTGRDNLFPMSALFRDARLKIERAKKHIAELKTAIISLEESQTSALKQDEKAGIQELTHTSPKLNQSLLEFSLIVGDAVHNLHTALDFAWANIIEAKIPSAKSDSTKFPVRPTREILEGCLHGIKVDVICPALLEIIVSKIQPYEGGQNGVIWTLHRLDISDKHLLLLELTPRTAIRGLVLRDNNGDIFRGHGMPVQGTGPFVIALESGVEIQNKGTLSVEITIQEAGIFKGVPVTSLLDSFTNFTLYTVELLESV